MSEINSTLVVQQFPSIEVPVNAFLASSVDSWLKNRTVGIWSAVGATTKNRLETIAYRALVDGDTLEEMADRFQRELPQYTRMEAKRIARTETTGAMNFGQHAERVELGIEHKEWVSTIDARTRGVNAKDRFDHINMFGEVVFNNDSFDVSGERMLFPGDTSQGASAGNIIHCRCCAVAAFPEGGVIPKKPKLKPSEEDRKGKKSEKKRKKTPASKPPKKRKPKPKKVAPPVPPPVVPPVVPPVPPVAPPTTPPQPPAISPPQVPLTRKQQQTLDMVNKAQNWANSQAAKDEMDLASKALNSPEVRASVDPVVKKLLAIQNKIDEYKRELKRINEEWYAFLDKEQISNKIKDALASGDVDEYSRLTTLHDTKHKEATELHDRVKKAYEKFLSTVQSKSYDAIASGLKTIDRAELDLDIPTSLSSKKTGATAKQAAKFLNRITHKSVTGGKTKVRIRETAKAIDGDREYYKPKEIVGGQVQPGAAFLNGKTPVQTAVHELGHHLEYESDQHLVRGFLLKRTQGEAANALVDKFPIPQGIKPEDWYGHLEVTWEDEFWKALNSRLNGCYAAKYYENGATEIIAMGVELLHLNPIAFAQRDPEYFRFIISFLRGDLQKVAAKIAASP